MEVAKKLAKKHEAARLAGGKSAPTPVADTGTEGQIHGLWTNDNGHGCAIGDGTISMAKCVEEAKLQTFFLDTTGPEAAVKAYTKSGWNTNHHYSHVPPGCVMGTQAGGAWGDVFWNLKADSTAANDGKSHYKLVHGPGAKYPKKRCYAPTKVYKTFALKGKKHSRVKIKMDIWNVGNIGIDGKGFEVKIFAGERLDTDKFGRQGDGKIPKKTVHFFTPWWGTGHKKPWISTAMVEHQMRAEKTFNFNGNPGASYQSIETPAFDHYADTLEVRASI